MIRRRPAGSGVLLVPIVAVLPLLLGFVPAALAQGEPTPEPTSAPPALAETESPGATDTAYTTPAEPTAATPSPSASTPASPPADPGGFFWVMLANLIIWGGIALYVLFLHGRLRRLERDAGTGPPAG